MISSRLAKFVLLLSVSMLVYGQDGADASQPDTLVQDAVDPTKDASFMEKMWGKGTPSYARLLKNIQDKETMLRGLEEEGKTEQAA